MSRRLLWTLGGAGMLAATLLGSIVWASASEDLFTGFGRVVDLRWGLVTMIDLYCGLLFAGAWIAAMERGRPWVAAAWLVALLLLGNLATMTYVLSRARGARQFGDLFRPRTPKAQGEAEIL